MGHGEKQKLRAMRPLSKRRASFISTSIGCICRDGVGGNASTTCRQSPMPIPTRLRRLALKQPRQGPDVAPGVAHEKPPQRWNLVDPSHSEIANEAHRYEVVGHHPVQTL